MMRKNSESAVPVLAVQVLLGKPSSLWILLLADGPCRRGAGLTLACGAASINAFSLCPSSEHFAHGSFVYLNIDRTKLLEWDKVGHDKRGRGLEQCDTMRTSAEGYLVCRATRPRASRRAAFPHLKLDIVTSSHRLKIRMHFGRCMFFQITLAINRIQCVIAPNFP